VLAVPIAITSLLAFTIKPQKKYVSDLHLVKDITVVIDAGHGLIEGKHSGAAYQEFNEDDIVLSLAKRIQSLNQNEKVHIVLSRPSEKIVELHDRVTVASDHHADLFLSLHMNYTDNKEPASTTGEKTTSGMEVCLSGKLPSYLPQSEVFGSLLQQELSTVYTTLPYLTKVKSGVWVLDHNACPSVLIECGYINNKKDRDFISDRTNQDLLAGKILKAIERYASSQ
jgi:N-acetylmuramoyl-L-alanine amidase